MGWARASTLAGGYDFSAFGARAHHFRGASERLSHGCEGRACFLRSFHLATLTQLCR